MRTNPKEKGKRNERKGGEAVPRDPEARIQGRGGAKTGEWSSVAVGTTTG